MAQPTVNNEPTLTGIIELLEEQIEQAKIEFEMVKEHKESLRTSGEAIPPTIHWKSGYCISKVNNLESAIMELKRLKNNEKGG